MKQYHYVPESVVLINGKAIIGKVKEFEFTYNIESNYDKCLLGANLDEYDLTFRHEPISLSFQSELNNTDQLKQ